MTYGMDPEEMERMYRATQTPRAVAGRLVMVVLLVILFGGIVIVMAS